MMPEAQSGESVDRGFTLVELLVSIAVLAVLAALILSAVARAQQMAHRIQCVGNLRQLGLAAEMYWNDHDGRTFRFRGPSTNGGTIYWFGWIERWNGANEGRRAFDARPAALYPYLQGRGVDACPSLRRDDGFKWKASGATHGYGYNRHLSTPTHVPPLSMQEVRQPDATVLMADAAQVNDFQFPATPQRPLLEEFYYVSALEPTVHFRHADKANVLFCDGHVEQRRAVAGSWDPRMPDRRVGRLPGPILEIGQR